MRRSLGNMLSRYLSTMSEAAFATFSTFVLDSGIIIILPAPKIIVPCLSSLFLSSLELGPNARS